MATATKTKQQITPIKQQAEFEEHTEDSGPEPSVLFDSFKKIKEEKDAEDSKTEEVAVKREKEKKEEPKEETKKELEDFDPSSFDETQTPDGKKYGEKTADVFKKFKESAKKRAEKIEALEKEVAELKNKKEVPADYADIQKERDELRSQVDTEYFYNSKEFVSKYTKPMQDAEGLVKKSIAALEDRQRESITPLLQKANKALLEGDEKAFYDLTDEIVDESFSPSNGRKFASHMSDLWDKTQALNEAYKDKESARSTIKKSIEENAAKTKDSAASYLDVSVDAFMKDNEKVIDLYENNEDMKKEYDYKKELKSDLESAKIQLNEFVATGKMSKDLSDLIYRGVLLRSRTQEIKMQSGVIGYQSNKILKLSERVAELEEENKKLGSTDNSASRKPKETETKKQEGSILYNALKEAREGK